jgi:hypothetical protein
MSFSYFLLEPGRWYRTHLPDGVFTHLLPFLGPDGPGSASNDFRRFSRLPIGLAYLGTAAAMGKWRAPPAHPQRDSNSCYRCERPAS